MPPPGRDDRGRPIDRRPVPDDEMVRDPQPPRPDFDEQPVPHLIDMVPQAILFLSAGGLVEAANTACQLVFQVDARSLAATHVTSYFQTDGAETLRRLLRSLDEAPVSTPQAVLLRIDDSRPAYSATWVPCGGPHRLAFLSIVTPGAEADVNLGADEDARERPRLGLTVTDLTRHILYVNSWEAEMHGYQQDELVGQDAVVFAPKERRRPPLNPDTLGRAHRWRRETVNVRKDGTPFPIEILSDAIRSRDGLPLGVISISQDISSRRRRVLGDLRTPISLLNREAGNLAPADGVFEAHNVADRASEGDNGSMRESASRRSPSGDGLSILPRGALAILMIGFDDTSELEKRLGPTSTAELFQQIRAMITAEMDDEASVSAVGNHRFVVCIHRPRHAGYEERHARRILKLLASPFSVAGQLTSLSPRIGVAARGDTAREPFELLADAEAEMHRAKELDLRMSTFDPRHRERGRLRLQLEADIRKVTEKDELFLYYQPIVSLEQGTISGFEGLVRWRHPQRGVILPDVFIPVAEETGTIGALGAWVLQDACRQFQDWRRQQPSAERLALSVNLSPRQLTDLRIVEDISRVLDESGLPADRLNLEVTESAVVDHLETATSILIQLRDLGVRACIDDFGTGYSSLSYLSSFPVDTLKIDRSFIQRLGTPSARPELIETMLRLADDLGLDVVAEGVETREQLDWLRRLRCPYVQGYLFSRPVPAWQAWELFTQAESA